MVSYFYKIYHEPTKMVYVGSQYSKNASPDKFWVDYFTSSNIVKNLIKQYGKESFIIKEIQIRKDAREFEAEFIQQEYKNLGREKFLEIYLNRNLAPGILLNEEMIEKANKKRKISSSVAAKKRIENGTHNFLTNKYPHSKEWFEKIRKRMNGPNNPSKNPEIIMNKITKEYRLKQAENAKGNTNVRGYKWWNDGKTNRRSKESPGENYKPGIIKKV